MLYFNKYNPMQTLLIAEDKDSMARMLKETLEAEGYRVVLAKNGAEALKLLREERPELVLTDLKLPMGDGMEVLRATKEESPLTPVIVMTAYGSVETAVAAMKEGAFDFITKPFDTDHLVVLVARALENQRLMTENILLRDEFSSELGLPVIIGKSPGMVGVAKNIQKVAPTSSSVVILGESGTGKELFARAIHHLSPRKDYPFVPINCAAIPAGLLESELFGFEKGSFTGAHARKLGKFELAHKGSVFLDEVAELGLQLQAKLLRVLQEGELERIGSTSARRVDVRVIAAANKDLEAAVGKGTFREDLFYRLSVFPIEIPPLRSRREDIPLLADYFINKYSGDLTRNIESISEDALGLLMEHTWKGNVRELENTIERAIILSDGPVILPEHIVPGVIKADHAEDEMLTGIPMDGPLDRSANEARRIVETRRIRKALAESGGNKTRAARALSVSYKTLLTKIKEYSIK